jgi:phage anti-repressor protein
MGTSELRQALHLFIDQADERFLRMINSLAKEYSNDEDASVSLAGNDISKSELYQALKKAEKEIENGDYISIEEFSKESEKWG